jgi:hypothetical protein
MSDTPTVFVLRQSSTLYRVRLSQDILQELQWPKDEEFDCLGFFRVPGELLCAAQSNTNEDGSHPFDPILRFRNHAQQKNIHALADIPPASVLTAPFRIFNFKSKWTTDTRTQLDLQLGTEVTKRLGWGSEPIRPIYARAWSRLLLLVSESRFVEVQSQDFTSWIPPDASRD